MRAYYISTRLIFWRWKFCLAYHRKRIIIFGDYWISSVDGTKRMPKEPFPSQPRFPRMPASSRNIPSHHRNKFTPVSTHQVLLPIRDPLVERLSIYNVDSRNNRRVTFDESSHSAHRSRFRSVSNTARTMTPLDSRIGNLEGTTSTLECLPHRLRIFKSSQPISLKQRIEELTREAGHLRQKLTYHKKTRAACMKFFDATNQAQQNFQNAIVKMSRKMTISEQRFENYWKSQPDEGNWEKLVF